MKKRPSRTAHFSVFYSCGGFNTPMLASGLLICFFYKMNMNVASPYTTSTAVLLRR